MHRDQPFQNELFIMTQTYPTPFDDILMLFVMVWVPSARAFKRPTILFKDYPTCKIIWESVKINPRRLHPQLLCGFEGGVFFFTIRLAYGSTKRVGRIREAQTSNSMHALWSSQFRESICRCSQALRTLMLMSSPRHKLDISETDRKSNLANIKHDEDFPNRPRTKRTLAMPTLTYFQDRPMRSNKLVPNMFGLWTLSDI